MAVRASSDPQRILRAGHNCWRVERAHRAAFIVDGAAYFTAIAEAFAQARHSIVLVGWDVDFRMRLRASDDSPTLGGLLKACVAARPDLHAWVLGWDFSPIYWLERDPLLRLRLALSRHVHFALDNCVPSGASQHHKIVVIDDALAFCGGLDLCDVRWDTPAHRAADERRRDVHGRPYRPHHDVQMAVDGPAAAALGAFARERWEKARGRWIPPTPATVTSFPWPSSLPVDVESVDVGISRTRACHRSDAEIHEVETLWIDSLAAAKTSVYIENPFFTSESVLEAMERSAAEIVLVTPQESSGWLEDLTMGMLRDEAIAKVRAGPAADRLHVLTPWLPAAQPGGEPISLNLHSKVCIVDDQFLRIGSSNLANRSMGFDSECDLAIEANGRGDVAAAIRRLRDRLVGEHVDAAPEAVAAEVERTASLAAAITALTDGDRRLSPYVQMPSPLASELLPEAQLLDPPRPIATREVGRWLSQPRQEHADARRWRYAGLAWWATFIAALVVARLTGVLDADAMMRLVAAVRDAPALAGIGVVATFVVGGLMFVPVTVMILGCGALFGPWLGVIYALLGAFGAAAVFHVLGRHTGRPLIDALAGPRLRDRLREVAKRGLLAVAVLRLLPIAPHVVVGLAAGAARVSMRDYMLGTMLVMTPGAAALVVLGHLAAGGAATATTTTMIVGGVVLLLATAVVLTRRWMMKRSARQRDRVGAETTPEVRRAT